MPLVNSKSTRRVLVFNPVKKLVAVYQSVTSAARTFQTTPTNVHFACVGKSISCCNLYFRHLSDDVEITLDDLGTLKLEDYDKLCGVTRKYYPTKSMGGSITKTKTQK